jgi:hypothetical protein
MSDLRYPVGKFTWTGESTDAERHQWIDEIAKAPAALRAAVAGLTPPQLDTPYRPDGWTARQVVHHLADSHLHAFARFKFALVENNPTIKPYDEATWAALPDSRLPPDASLALVEALHARWVALLRSMTPADFERTYIHPEHRRAFRLDEALGLYAWHGRHHVAHITALRRREGW